MFGFVLLTVLIAEFTQRTDGSLVFIKEPSDTKYVLKGNDLILKWEFYTDKKPADFNFATWDVYVEGTGWRKMIGEDTDGTVFIHNERPPLYSGRVEKRDQATLIVTNMTFEDSSEYRCVLTALNGLRTEGVVKVIVTGPAVCRPGVQFAKQGDSATIACNATNVPRENITCSTKGVRDSQEVASCYEISVKDVSLSDLGYYSCDASAIVNETNVDFCYLQVIYPVKKDYAFCPRVSHFARIGQTLSICCPVSSYPPPRNVTWTKNGTQLQQGSETILTIILDKDEKFGNYTCAASDDNPSTEPIEEVITVMKEISELPVMSISETDAKAAKLEWTPHTQAEYYLVDIRGLDDVIFDDVVYAGKETSLEIHYNTLVTKKAEKKPEKIEVCPVVSAFRNGTVIGRTTKACLTVRSHQMTLKADISCFLLVFIGYLVW